MKRVLGIVGDAYAALVAFYSQPFVLLGVVETLRYVVFALQSVTLRQRVWAGSMRYKEFEDSWSGD